MTRTRYQILSVVFFAITAGCVARLVWLDKATSRLEEKNAFKLTEAEVKSHNSMQSEQGWIRYGMYAAIACTAKCAYEGFANKKVPAQTEAVS